MSIIYARQTINVKPKETQRLGELSELEACLFKKVDEFTVGPIFIKKVGQKHGAQCCPVFVKGLGQIFKGLIPVFILLV